MSGAAQALKASLVQKIWFSNVVFDLYNVHTVRVFVYDTDAVEFFWDYFSIIFERFCV